MAGRIWAKENPKQIEERAQLEYGTYLEHSPTLPLKFEAMAEVVTGEVSFDIRDDEMVSNYDFPFAAWGTPAQVFTSAKTLHDAADTLDLIGEAVVPHQKGDDVAATDLIRSRIKPTP